jgi:diguanylate cyclase (GGDEF)-like protein
VERIWHQANYDELTGLPNRHMFLDRLRQAMRKADRDGAILALLFLDLDHFKDVNDRLGHAMGDLLLSEAAQRIGGCVRATDTIARLGGDEFTVILTGLDRAGMVDRIARSILAALAAPFTLGDESATISASIGVALYPADAREVGMLLEHADQAMYAAKNDGRNRYRYFKEEGAAG